MRGTRSRDEGDRQMTGKVIGTRILRQESIRGERSYRCRTGGVPQSTTSVMLLEDAAVTSRDHVCAMPRSRCSAGDDGPGEGEGEGAPDGERSEVAGNEEKREVRKKTSDEREGILLRPTEAPPTLFHAAPLRFILQACGMAGRPCNSVQQRPACCSCLSEQGTEGADGEGGGGRGEGEEEGEGAGGEGQGDGERGAGAEEDGRRPGETLYHGG